MRQLENDVLFGMSRGHQGPSPSPGQSALLRLPSCWISYTR